MIHIDRYIQTVVGEWFLTDLIILCFYKDLYKRINYYNNRQMITGIKKYL
jgi:hypothetical protein